MAEEIGGIVYEVGMDTTGLQKGNQRLRDEFGRFIKTTDGATDALGGLDGAAKKTGKSFGGLGGAANSLKTSLSTLAASISIALVMDWAKSFLTVADNMTQLQARIARLSTDAAAAKQTFSDLADIASRTGASLSDTTKLWESLTSSLKEAGATNAQVLNLTDTLQKIGRIGGTSTEEMANALRQFGQSIASGTIRAEEFNSILEQMPELARQIATGLGVSMGELRQLMLAGKLTAEDALNAIQDRAGAVNAEFTKLPRSLSQATGSLETSFAKLVASINETTGASTLAVESIDRLSKYVDFLGDKSTSTSDKLWSLAAVIAKLNPGYAATALVDAVLGDDAPEKVVDLSNTINNLTGDLAAATSGTNKATEATKHFTIAATASSTASKKASTDAKKTASEQESIAQKLEKLQQKAMLAAGSTQELSRAQAVLNAQQSLGKGATQDQIKLAGEYAGQAYDVAAALKAQQKAEKDKQDTERDYSAVRKQASPVAGLDDQFQQQMASLNAYATLYPQKIAEVEATRAAIEQTYRDQRMTAMWAEWQQQNVAAQLFGETLDASLSTMSNSLTGLITGTQTLNDALANIGSTILNTVVNSFVQMGAEWVRSAVMGSTAQIAATTATTAASVAGTATTTAASTAAAATTTAAWTPAAIAASIGSFGGAAAIGIGAVIAAMALSGSIAGKRKNGGPVSGGSTYQVGESNLPEIYQASNGSQYMIPGDSGKVISNRDMMSGGGGGGGVVIYNTVTNNSSSARASTSATDNGDGSITIQTIVSDIEENGEIGQAISRTYDTQRKANE